MGNLCRTQAKTHPGVAALADPLSACGGKRVRKEFSAPYFSSVSRTASGESGQNSVGLCGCRGIASFAEAGGNEGAKQGK